MKSIIKKYKTGRIEVIDKGTFEGWHDKLPDVLQKNIIKFKHLKEGIYEINYTYESIKDYDPYVYGYGNKVFTLKSIKEII